jgi:hypothetical protein
MHANLVFKELSHSPFGRWRADIRKLMKGSLELESTPYETGRETARHGVLLQEKHLHTFGGQLCGRAQASVPGTDDDAVVSPFELLPGYAFSHV